MILVVDTRGFTTNILTHQLGAVDIVSAAELAALNLQHYSHVVLPHGPDAVDVTPLVSHPDLPVLAIGSGYQRLAAAYGHTAVAPVQPVYGQPVTHQHTAAGLFAGIPDPTQLTSYHAWRLVDMPAERFAVHAVDDAGAILAYQVVGTNHWGLHADPAAFQSTHGAQLLSNFFAPTQPVTAAAHRPPVEPVARRTVTSFSRQVCGPLNTVATFTALQQDASAAFWLDSAAAHLGQGDTTIMGTNAGPLAQTVRWDAETQRLDIRRGDDVTIETGDVLDYVHAQGWQPSEPLDLPGFTGGWIGYLGYEAKQATVAEHFNRWQATTPDAYWIKPQAWLRYDHRTEVTTLVAYDDPDALDLLEQALHFGEIPSPSVADPVAVPGDWRYSAHEYVQRVEQIRNMLRAGQAAGICLTDTYAADGYTADGLQLYQRLRVKNAAPYAGYLRFNTFGDELEILSASPEKFLSVDPAGIVESKPIKGTVARSSDPAVDAEVARQMAMDPKIQSENLMITDLLRDDLAKVTVPRSVAVPKLMAVESFTTVHQLVTTVTGQLTPNTPVTEALRAVFPGGSMTGAPKIVSLETLETLESGPRGVYSGAMGWVGDNNTAEFNVIIRSIVIDAGQLSLGAGGAVVVDSDPVAEELEKHLKARALLESIAEHR